MYHMILSDVYFRSSIMFFRPSDGASRRRDQWGPVARTPIFANDTATIKRFQNSQRQTQLLAQKGQVKVSDNITYLCLQTDWWIFFTQVNQSYGNLGYLLVSSSCMVSKAEK